MAQDQPPLNLFPSPSLALITMWRQSCFCQDDTCFTSGTLLCGASVNTTSTSPSVCGHSTGCQHSSIIAVSQQNTRQTKTCDPLAVRTKTYGLHKTGPTYGRSIMALAGLLPQATGEPRTCCPLSGKRVATGCRATLCHGCAPITPQFSSSAICMPNVPFRLDMLAQ